MPAGRASGTLNGAGLTSGTSARRMGERITGTGSGAIGSAVGQKA